MAPYYPGTDAVRQAYARYADNISYADRLAGEVLDQLESDGLAESTIVFFYSDHGAGMPRSKSFLFESSTRVPLLVRFPERFAQWAPGPPGSDTDRLVSFVDFAPTVLSLAGIESPQRFHGTAFLGPYAGPPRTHAFGYRDRMDERYELIRSVRAGRFNYIRNYFPPSAVVLRADQALSEHPSGGESPPRARGRRAPAAVRGNLHGPPETPRAAVRHRGGPARDQRPGSGPRIS